MSFSHIFTAFAEFTLHVLLLLSEKENNKTFKGMVGNFINIHIKGQNANYADEHHGGHQIQ